MDNKIKRYFQTIGQKGGLAKSLRKTIAARRNALISAEKRLKRKQEKENA